MTRLLPYMLVAAALMWVSCQPHDPFCLNHPHNAVIVEYDWSQAPDARDIRGTRVYFYHVGDKSLATRADFTGMEGGMIKLGEGEYDVVSYNSDTERVMWRGDNSLPTLETYTRETMLTEELPGYSYEAIEGLVLTPDRLWSGRVNRAYVSGRDTTVITITPRKVTYEVIWLVEGIKGARRVTACALSLGNVGGTLFLAGPATGENESLMSGIGTYVAGDDEAETGGFRGRFEAFGCPFDQDCRHILTIYCWSPGGNIKASYDVTDQFHRPDDDRKIYLHIDAGFEIPTGDGDGGEGGFDADVDVWGVVEEDLIL